MAKMKGTIVVDTERCKGCELCTVACPLDIITMSAAVNHRGYPFAQQSGEGCTGCTSCAVVCPDGCITVYRRKEETQP